MSNADEDTLRAMRAASPALQKRWPVSESPRSWKGVTWSHDHVQALNLMKSKLEVLPPQVGQLKALTSLNVAGCPLKELPLELGQLLALTNLVLVGCELTDADGRRAIDVAHATCRGRMEAARLEAKAKAEAKVRRLQPPASHLPPARPTRSNPNPA